MIVGSNYVIAIATPSDLLQNLAPIFQLMKGKTLLRAIFPRFKQVTGNC